MRHRGVAVVSAVLVLGSTLGAVAAERPGRHALRSSGVTATVAGDGAVLTNGLVTRQWSIGSDGTVLTTALRGADGTNWVASGPDFSLTIGGVPTGPGSGWT